MRLLAAVRNLSPDSFESFFLRRYDALLTRALHLTGQRRHDAEDLVHSTFVQCALRRLDVRTLEDPDAYLLVTLRNLWLSEVRRSQRLQQPTALDFDSVESALLECRYADRLRLADDLLAVCRFACERKEVSKSGSVLVLRFFLAFSPREVAAIAQLPLGHAHELIRLARREARRAVAFPPAAFSDESSNRSDLTQLAAQFKHTIAASTRGDCLAAETLDRLYSSRSVPVPTGLLAHVASCAQCLERVCTRLSLDDDRDPFDPPPPDHGGGVDRKHRARRLREALTQVREHQPLELRVVANGFEVGAMKTRPRINEMTHTVGDHEPLAIVEVFSDTGVRLMALHVEPPPEGPVAIDDTVILSGGRTLRVRVDFAELKPRVALWYDARDLADDAQQTATDARPTARERMWFGLFSQRFLRYLVLVLALLAGVAVANAMDLPAAIADAFRRIVGMARPAALNDLPSPSLVPLTALPGAATAVMPAPLVESTTRRLDSPTTPLADIEAQVWIRLHELRLDLAGTLRTLHDRGHVVVRGSVATDADRAALAALANDLLSVRTAVRSMESMAPVVDAAPPVDPAVGVNEPALTMATTAIAGSVLTQAVDIQLNAEAALRIVRVRAAGSRDVRDATRRRLEQVLAAYIDGILLQGAKLRSSLLTATGHTPPAPVLSCGSGEPLWGVDWEQLVMAARRLRATTETAFADFHVGPSAGAAPNRASVEERVPLLDRQVAAIQQSLTAHCHQR